MSIFLVIAVIVAIVAAFWDWRKSQIPNWVTMPIIGLAPIGHIVYSFEQGLPQSDALLSGAYSAAGALVCGVVPLLAYTRGSMGGGDVKLLAAIGALCRPMIGIEAELYGFVFATLIAPAYLAYEGKLFETLKQSSLVFANSFRRPSRRKEISANVNWFRMGPAIALGTILVAFLHWRTR